MTEALSWLLVVLAVLAMYHFIVDGILRRRTDDERPIPAPGELWLLKGNDDPWPNRYGPVKILDVRPGWVRYSMGSVFDDCRMRMDTFTAIYRRYNAPPKD